MAVDINKVYQKVLALSNKEQRGYITPQEFNLMADRAQNEIYENYFQQLNMSQVKPKSQGSHVDPVEVIERKLEPFIQDAIIGVFGADSSTTFNQGVALASYASTTAPGPLDNFFVQIISESSRIIHLKNRTTGDIVTKVSNKELNKLNLNPLTKPTLKRQVFTNYLNIGLKLHPPPLQDTLYDAVFYRQPRSPNWSYVVVGEKPLFNDTNSTDFELLKSEEENLVSRILIMSGVTLKQPDLQQAGVGSIQLNKQEQNN
tara:strand:- start:548 stop:1324 length:777 start_codon:yes stop_codon:yes gene_type:complete